MTERPEADGDEPDGTPCTAETEAAIRAHAVDGCEVCGNPCGCNCEQQFPWQ